MFTFTTIAWSSIVEESHISAVRQAECQTRLSRDVDFPITAKKLLVEHGVYLAGGTECELSPDMEAYGYFLQFLIEELEALPLKNEIGATKLKKGGKKLIKGLIAYLRKKLDSLKNGLPWDASDFEEIAWIFDGREVFKNIISEGDGIGYNLDLSYGLPDSGISYAVVLNRRYVCHHMGREVLNPNGDFRLILSGEFAGYLILDLQLGGDWVSTIASSLTKRPMSTVDLPAEVRPLLRRLESLLQMP